MPPQAPAVASTTPPPFANPSRPDDYDELVAGAEELHPEAKVVGVSADSVVMQKTVRKQFLHVLFDKIRQHQGRLPASAAAGPVALAQAVLDENKQLKARLDKLEQLLVNAAVGNAPAGDESKPAKNGK